MGTMKWFLNNHYNKINPGENTTKGMWSAVEKLNSIEISWNQPQNFCGPQVVSGSHAGPLTAGLFAQVREVLEVPVSSLS
jgi:hypothetical protein